MAWFIAAATTTSSSGSGSLAASSMVAAVATVLVDQVLTSPYGLAFMAAIACTLASLSVFLVKSSIHTFDEQDELQALHSYAVHTNLPASMEKQLKQELQQHLLQERQQSAAVTLPQRASIQPSELRVAITQQLYLPLVKGLPAFRGCSDDFLKELVKEMETEFVDAGAVVVAAGEAATHLYVVLSGKLVREDAADILLPGCVFGKIAVMCDVPQLFTIRATEKSQLLRLSKKCLVEVVTSHPADCALLVAYLKKRLAANTTAVGSTSPVLSRSVSELAFQGHVDVAAAGISVVAAAQEVEQEARLCAAASKGDGQLLQQLLLQQPMLALCCDYNGRTPLHLAAGNGHVECVQQLVEFGADVNAIDRSGTSILAEAAKGGDVSIIATLLAAGAELRLRDPGSTLCRAAAAACCKAGSSSNNSGMASPSGSRTAVPRSPRAKGSSAQYLRRLLECGADVNAQDFSGCAALHVACAHSDMALVELLIAHGADPYLEDWSGNTPFGLAAERNDQQLLQMMGAQF